MRLAQQMQTFHNLNSMPPRTIAVEGPAASGKSTIGRLLAARLGYTFLDSGILYRFIAQNVLLQGVSPDDEARVTDLANKLDLALPIAKATDGNGGHAMIDLQGLRAPEIDQLVPIVARYPGVRETVRGLQRAAASRGRIVIAGRDIGTVVLPDADLKVFLSVSVEERARRRYAEQRRSGEQATMASTLEDLRKRDALDKDREISPMKRADDAIVVDADLATPDEIVKSIIEKLTPVAGTLT